MHGNQLKVRRRTARADARGSGGMRASGRKAADAMRPHCNASARPKARAAVLALAIIAALVTLSACSLVVPVYAYAAQQKHAEPTISKAVSLDGRTYAERVNAQAGAAVHYRINLTMPEGVEQLKGVTYTVKDKPDARISVDPASVLARVVGANGSEKARLGAKVQSARESLFIALGDLKATCPDLAFTDGIVVDYDARVDSGVAAEELPNVAQLAYDVGDGERKTVEVMARVLVDKPGEPGGSKIVKTGDGLMAVSAGCAMLAIVSALGLALARRRCN